MLFLLVVAVFLFVVGAFVDTGALSAVVSFFSVTAESAVLSAVSGAAEVSSGASVLIEVSVVSAVSADVSLPLPALTRVSP
ncbi:MAG: hypothetical protein IJC50_00560 [Clostridia bacterium]|nr:hypothetical protein [Clostridia bacterium]